MPLTLAKVTAPTADALTLAEAKAHARVEVAEDDGLIHGFLRDGQECFERVTGRALMTQTWRLYLDVFPYDQYGQADPIRVPSAPLASVTSITYYDAAGDLQTLSSSLYTVDTASEPGRIYPAPTETWPATQTDRMNAVIVQFVAGGSAANVPAAVKGRLQAFVAYRDRHRSEEINWEYLDSLFRCFEIGTMR